MEKSGENRDFLDQPSSSGVKSKRVSESEKSGSGKKEDPESANTSPIYIFGLKLINPLQNILGNVLKDANYTIKSVKAECVKIEVPRRSDFDKLLSVLDEMKISYSTQKRSKYFKAYIRNLAPDAEKEKIADELKSYGHEVVTINFILHKGIPVHRLELVRDENNRNICKIKRLLNTDVIIEAVLVTERPIQCIVCNEIGHIAKDCTKVPSCLRCAKNHLNEICPWDKETYYEGSRCAYCFENHMHPSKCCPYFKNLTHDFSLFTTREDLRLSLEEFNRRGERMLSKDRLKGKRATDVPGPSTAGTEASASAQGPDKYSGSLPKVSAAAKAPKSLTFSADKSKGMASAPASATSSLTSTLKFHFSSFSPKASTSKAEISASHPQTAAPRASIPKRSSSTSAPKALTSERKPSTSTPKALTPEPKPSTSASKALTPEPKPSTSTPKALTPEPKPSTSASKASASRSSSTKSKCQFKKKPNIKSSLCHLM